MKRLITKILETNSKKSIIGIGLFIILTSLSFSAFSNDTVIQTNDLSAGTDIIIQTDASLTATDQKNLSIPSTGTDAVVDTNKVKICLCMIVKNESAIIERCFKAVEGLVDCMVICDTGSTDKTKECIQSFMKRTGIPGKMYDHEWKNFGHNRSLSAQAAQETLKEMGFNLEKTYLLFLDADMILQITDGFNKQSLIDDSYLVLQKNPGYSYYNTRLARASLNWRCVGVTHEYWAADNNFRQNKTSAIYINDIGDGGAKGDKFDRDIRLLKQGLIDEPNNERYMYYLAQSYKDTQQWDNAIEWYTKRIEAGGWHEEIWMSKFMIGQCYEAKDEWHNALKYYLEAFQYYPARAESLAAISNYYLAHGKNDLACIFAKYGMKVAYPANDILVVTDSVYNYKFLETLSIASFYTAFKSKGCKYIDSLILNPRVPYQNKEIAHRNLFYYVEPLKDTEFIPITPATRSFVNQWSSDRYIPCNPSLYKTENGYTLNCRTVNYFHRRGLYVVLDDDNCVRTKNILIDYDKDFNKLSETPILENSSLAHYPSSVKGLEDMKIFEFKNEIYFTATSRELHPQDVPKICLGKLEKNGDYYIVNKVTLLHGPEPDRCEKNWLPFIMNDELYVVYSYSPFIIYKPNMETGHCEQVINKNYNLDMTRFRGSAAPIRFDDGYLLMIHEVIWQNARTYIHRFLYLDKNFELKKLSQPFTFKHTGVEFCSSMTLDHSNDKLIMGMGIEDKDGCLCIASADSVRSLLKPIAIK